MPVRLTVAPTLETERAILRPHRVEDFDAYCAMGTDPAVFRFIGGRARTREESWQRLLRHPGMWALIGFGFWAIEDKASGRFIGEAGFHELKRAIEPSIEGVPEAGWSLVAGLQGRGLGSEIVRRMHEWADAASSIPRMHRRSASPADAAIANTPAPPTTTIPPSCLSGRLAFERAPAWCFR